MTDSPVTARCYGDQVREQAQIGADVRGAYGLVLVLVLLFFEHEAEPQRRGINVTFSPCCPNGELTLPFDVDGGVPTSHND